MATLNIENRQIFCRDNLSVLRGVNSACIDLIYLDPPFNKNKKFAAPLPASAKGGGFEDIFRRERVKADWILDIKEEHPRLHKLLEAVKAMEGFKELEGEKALQDKRSYNYCYLVFMAIRLIECRRILKDTGSIYLHCDPTMSHYLKLAMDCIFGEKNFRNEIVWCYAGGGIPKKDFPNKFDVILRYTKTGEYIFNAQYRAYGEHIKSGKRATDLGGARKLDYNPKGTPINNWWTDIKPIINWHKERVDYATQKPLALLERIIKSSSNIGEIVLDPFCGCSTAPVAAEELDRFWIGIDVSVKAYEMVKERMNGIQKKMNMEGDEDKAKKYAEALQEIDDNFSTDAPKRTDDGAEPRSQRFVYVMSHPNYPNDYKVGVAANVDKRIASYQTGDPKRQYKLEHSRRFENANEVEDYIHEKFGAKPLVEGKERLGEWVTADLQAIIDAIEGY